MQQLLPLQGFSTHATCDSQRPFHARRYGKRKSLNRILIPTGNGVLVPVHTAFRYPGRFSGLSHGCRCVLLKKHTSLAAYLADVSIRYNQTKFKFHLHRSIFFLT